MDRRAVRKGLQLSTMLLFGAPAAAVPLYTVVDLGTGHSSEINSHGEVVGFSGTTMDERVHSFLYSNGQMLDLGLLGEGSSFAYDINDSGDVVGYGYLQQGDPHEGPYRAFLYHDGTLQDLGTLGGSNSDAFAINSAGQIVGSSSLTGDARFHAALFDNGSVLDLGTLGDRDSHALDINDQGDAVGVAGFQPVLFSDGSVLDLGSLGGDEGEAYGINASGQIVGWSDNEFGDPHAFLYFDGVMHDLGILPGGLWSWAWDVNSHGHVIGEAPSPQHEGFGVGVLFWQGGIYDLNDLIPADRGWTIEETSAINDAGQISAYGCNRITGECHALRLDPRAAIAEPGSLALLGFGLAALGLFRCRPSAGGPSKAR